jgi:hypothetical protein
MRSNTGWTATYRGYVQLNTGGISSTRPYDWTLVAVAHTREMCKLRVENWIREANRHQSNPTTYHIHITEETG